MPSFCNNYKNNSRWFIEEFSEAESHSSISNEEEKSQENCKGMTKRANTGTIHCTNKKHEQTTPDR